MFILFLVSLHKRQHMTSLLGEVVPNIREARQPAMLPAPRTYSQPSLTAGPETSFASGPLLSFPNMRGRLFGDPCEPSKLRLVTEWHQLHRCQSEVAMEEQVTDRPQVSLQPSDSWS